MSTAPGPYLGHHNFTVCAGSLLKQIHPQVPGQCSGLLSPVLSRPEERTDFILPRTGETPIKVYSFLLQ